MKLVKNTVVVAFLSLNVIQAASAQSKDNVWDGYQYPTTYETDNKYLWNDNLPNCYGCPGCAGCDWSDYNNLY